MIHILHERAAKQQLQETMDALATYIKLAGDIDPKVLADDAAMYDTPMPK